MQILTPVCYGVFPAGYGHIWSLRLEMVTTASKRCDSLQVLCTQPKLTFFSQVQNQKRGWITMERMEIEDNAFLGSMS